MTQNYQKNSKKNKIDNSNVAWNASNLFYIYLNELDIDYRDAYYTDDWTRMYKVFELKYMKVESFIKGCASEKEKEELNGDKAIRKLIEGFKGGDSDHSNRFNSDIITQISDTIKDKMRLIDSLMSKAGMNVLMIKNEEDIPAALATDDFIGE